MDADAFRDIIVLVISYTQTKQKTAFDGYIYLIYNDVVSQTIVHFFRAIGYDVYIHYMLNV